MAAKDRTKAKLELRKHLSAIRMEPQPVDGKGYYVAEGAWDLLAGFDSGPGKDGEARLLVAGVCATQHMHIPFRVPLVQ